MSISSLMKMVVAMFTIVCVLFCVGILSLLSTSKIQVKALEDAKFYTEIGYDVKTASDKLTSLAREYCTNGNLRAYGEYMQELEQTQTIQNALELLMENNARAEDIELLESAIDISYGLDAFEIEAFDLADEGNYDEAMQIVYGDNYKTVVNDVYEALDIFHVEMNNHMNGVVTETKQNVEFLLNLMIALLGILIISVVITSIVFIFIMKKKINPLKKIAELSNEVANGNLNVNGFKESFKANDEVGMVIDAFKKITNSLNMVIMDMTQMNNEHKAGDYEFMMDENKFTGAYKEMITGVNDMVSMYTESFLEVMMLMQCVGKGDFHAPIRQYPGKQAISNEIIEEFRSKLIYINKEIIGLGEAAVNGILSKRVDTSNFEGDWLKMICDINNMLNAFSEPITEAADVLAEVAKGNLSAKINGDYKGDFDIIKNSMNNMTDEIAAYISDITHVLGAIADDSDLRVNIERDFIGDFSGIKSSINTIVNRLNEFMREINSVSEQVAYGSRQISESTMALAQGATEQTSSVEEITESINAINEKSSENANNANTANELGAMSKENASKGNEDMYRTLQSMAEIKDASSKISHVIKVIDDIAFQTNLLALNAAVEAARAGAHGKGFSIVAEEVRNLAGKSKDAAKETSQMIEDTIQKVNEGSDIAKNTAESLEKIVLNVSEMSNIMEKIFSSSSEQSIAVLQSMEEIKQISEVAHNNAATSEETAAAVEELSGQSEVMKRMASTFKVD